MSDRVRVKMEATFLLRTYMPDWRDSADLDVAIRLVEALFEEVDVSFEGKKLGDCTCSMAVDDLFTTGEPSDPDPSCPWHGNREKGGA